jgi:hypothetical protein
MFYNRLCGLVVRSRGTGSIPGAKRFFEKQCVWNGVYSESWVQLRSYLREKVAAPVKKTENTAVEIRRANLYPQKFALTSPTRGGGRSIDKVRSRVKVQEFSFLLLFMFYFIFILNVYCCLLWCMNIFLKLKSTTLLYVVFFSPWRQTLV